MLRDSIDAPAPYTKVIGVCRSNGTSITSVGGLKAASNFTFHLHIAITRQLITRFRRRGIFTSFLKRDNRRSEAGRFAETTLDIKANSKTSTHQQSIDVFLYYFTLSARKLSLTIAGGCVHGYAS